MIRYVIATLAVACLALIPALAMGEDDATWSPGFAVTGGGCQGGTCQAAASPVIKTPIRSTVAGIAVRLQERPLTRRIVATARRPLVRCRDCIRRWRR